MSLKAVQEAIERAMSVVKAAADPIRLDLPLPGPDYERFHLSTGDPVLWRSEETSQGKKVRFRALGPGKSIIGYHEHRSAEILIAESGVLFYGVGGEKRALLPRETYTSQPHQLHYAEFQGPGEATVQWPDLEGDSIDVSFFPS